MTPEMTVSVVIPTICRESLRTAVESALNQTRPPAEVVVVVDAPGELHLPSSPAINVVRTPGRVGPSMAKHIGVEAASGNVIALLDDDDVWLPDKLEKQLAAAPPGDEWILSSRFTIHSDDGTSTVGPKTVITPHESVAAYLYEFRAKRSFSMLPTPTLVFPRSLADTVPWSVAAGAIHDDPTWLIEVRRARPQVPIIQVPEPLVDVMWTPASLSRSGVDRSKVYIAWGVKELADESPRVRGDYMLTSGVGSALGAGSPRGVARAIMAGVRYGRPGPLAWASAAKSVLKVGVGRMKAR
ncbi:glycosyltransferase family 2 protein [Mycobacterium crocinum]|uniref:Glycosyltransferase n=1 Tax=Mycolicibacterium crocinum TaxID=388459 RepID=A0ABY3TSD1_9MYCO|nr:glycosyltransferase family 2 protein [Mycolicibacterium crocinum]MCV7217314.1 glycosyltransferase family 2 protein [Mycolicibacterium crocinum]ULN42213.1 glycosyltransferase [Mycolicibacterium crocinum]